MRKILVAALALTSLAAVPAGADPVLPDPKLTPGAFAETSTSVICAPGYARSHRVWHDKAGTLAKYHIPLSAAGRYEDDDLIPVCLGGDNASPLNHWPQPNAATPGAADKDERKICAEVCRARDDALLARYRAAFAKDWVALWRAKAR